MKTNEAAIEKARALIEAHQYVLESDWSEAQPSTDDENEFLEKHDWEAYGQWFLGEHTDQSPETKGRYGFPYGDFRRVHRSGLVAAKQRAAQNNYPDVERAADTLLELLDKQSA